MRLMRTPARPGGRGNASSSSSTLRSPTSALARMSRISTLECVRRIRPIAAHSLRATDPQSLFARRAQRFRARASALARLALIPSRTSSAL